jgi:hypothetical protein
MAVSLDNTSYTIPLSSSSRHLRSPSEAYIDSHLHVIRGTSQNVANRFHDKTFTLIVDPSTRAGAAGEHAPVDALVPSIVAEYGLTEGVDVTSFATQTPGAPEHGEIGWERLDWVGDEKAWGECRAAAVRTKKIIDDSDDSVLYFEKFGAEWIKSYGRLSLFLLDLSQGRHTQETIRCLPMLSSRWQYSLPGTRPAGSSRRHTKRYSRVCSEMGERRQCGHSAGRVGNGF